MGAEGLYIAKKVPVLTTTQRDLLIAVEGMLVFNSTTDQLEEYDGATWEAVGQIILDTHAALTIAHGTVDDIADQTDIATHAADLDAHTRNPYELYKLAQYVTTPLMTGTTPTNEVPGANSLRCIPFPIARPCTIDEIAIHVTTAGQAGAKARLGIYSDGGAVAPGALLLDAGEIDATGTGLKAVASLSQALARGLYWLAFVCNDATIGIARGASYTSIQGDPTALNAQYDCGYYAAHTYGALPATFPSMTALGVIYAMALHFESMD